MLNEAARAALVLAMSPEGDVTVIKNTQGSRMREDGLRALARGMHRQDRERMLTEWVRAGHVKAGSVRLADIDA